MDSRHRDDWIVIGIAGVTCGGKTTLANKLKNALVPSYLFHQDKYFFTDDYPKHIKCEDLDHNNYDILSALDMDRMLKDIMETLAGNDRSHAGNVDRKEGKIEMPGKKFLIVEGFTTLNYKPIMEMCNLRYYFVLEYFECVSRRAFRLYDPPDVPGYFDKCVWPEHLKYRAEMERDPRVIFLDGTRPDVFDRVINDIRELGGTEIQQ